MAISRGVPYKNAFGAFSSAVLLSQLLIEAALSKRHAYRYINLEFSHALKRIESENRALYNIPVLFLGL